MTFGKSKRLLAGIVMLWLVQVVPAQVAPDSGTDAVWANSEIPLNYRTEER